MYANDGRSPSIVTEAYFWAIPQKYVLLPLVRQRNHRLRMRK
jgi:hypothetical protein